MSKKEKKKEQKGQISKSSRLLRVCLFFFSFLFKKSTKAKTKGITDTDSSQEKTQDQRNLDVRDVILLLFLPLRKKAAAVVPSLPP